VDTAVRLGVWEGRPSITLVAGEHDATFLPECGMLGASLRHRGEEFAAWPRPLDDFLGGSMTALPLVHPWGNRLESRRYRWVAVLHTRPNGDRRGRERAAD